jgi:nicotinate-nucleotide adenylyltransferase
MRIGMFGGTFDPPHLGHLKLASEACDQLKLDRLLWMLTPNPPHKPDQIISGVNDRFAMLGLMLEDDPRFEISRIEIDRPPPQYTVDTIAQVRSERQTDALILLIGGDSLRDLPTWRDPIQLTAWIDEIGVLLRPGVVIDLASLETKIPGITPKIRFVDSSPINIASSDIRKLVHAGRNIQGMTASKVCDYIKSQNLYR